MRRKLRMLDLFSGLGGASAAMVDRGWDVITVDIEPSFRCTHTADLLTWTYDGPSVDLVWASPPCTEFSRDYLPWLRGKYPPPSLDLASSALRIIRDVCPIWWVVENVRGSVRHLTPLFGREPTQVGQCFLWGDFEPLGNVKVSARKERLPSRRRAERSKVPPEISLAVAVACERSVWTLCG